MVAFRTSGVPGILAIAVAAIGASACGYDCGTARRTVASASIRDGAGVTLATVEVDLSENVRPSFLRLSAGVIGSPGSAGAPLRGHVTRARLVTESGSLLAEIPTGTATLQSDAVVALNVDLPSRAEYDRVRSALLTAGVKIILETDLPGREQLDATLSDARDAPGNMGRCFPT
jgi:hypothetical protein